ncbi:hypothetical protein Q9L58_009640 [Maublancomyces gigas]|uniref:Uncharacterized protein n=1 Tax=Discina gigas TaxID=1032678 RepID=A0ABR3G7C9_9PEZI
MAGNSRQFEPRHDSSRFAPYTPNPQNSLPLPSDRMAMLRDIISLYAGNPSEEAMRHYHEESVYDDPLSFCDTRYKIAGQWYGLPKAFKRLNPKEYEVVENESDEVIFKLRLEYTIRGIGATKLVDSLVTLKLDPNEEKPTIRYHRDQWNEKDHRIIWEPQPARRSGRLEMSSFYPDNTLDGIQVRHRPSHEELGYFFEEHNGNRLAKVAGTSELLREVGGD